MICDLAETYHILNYEELSPILVATLVIGLRDNSRVKMKLSDSKITLDQMLMAVMVDNLNFLSWTKTKSATKNKNKPKLILKKLMGEDKEEKDELMIFETVEEYQAFMDSKREGWSNG